MTLFEGLFLSVLYGETVFPPELVTIASFVSASLYGLSKKEGGVVMFALAASSRFYSEPT